MIARSFFTDRFKMSVNGEALCGRTNLSRCPVYSTGDTGNWSQVWADWSDEPNWSDKGISWQSDRNEKFKNSGFDANSDTKIGQWQQITGVNLPNVENEDFIVWMRVAALPDFRKLHRIIHDKDLNKGDQLNITAASWFPVNKFGEKYVAIGTTTWAGLQNYALAWSLISLSVAGIALALMFGVLLLFNTRKLAEVDRFKWHNRQQNHTLMVVS